MYEVEMILTYVPEAEYMSFGAAYTLAQERDKEAAQLLMESLIEGGVA